MISTNVLFGALVLACVIFGIDQYTRVSTESYGSLRF